VREREREPRDDDGRATTARAMAAFETDAARERDARGRAYVAHWDAVYREQPSQLDREWHASAAACLDVARGHVVEAMRASSSGRRVVVDVGCGSSSVGRAVLEEEAFGARALVLVDCAPAMIDALRGQYAGDGRVRCVTGDARNLREVFEDASTAVAIDKGTLDALNGDDDKRAMLEEMVRILEEDGVILSVSFASVGRFFFLKRETARLGLTWRFRVVAEGDPARGHSAVFVSVLHRASRAETFRDVAFEEDALTRTLVRRMETSGSIIEDDDDEDEAHLDFSRDEL